MEVWVFIVTMVGLVLFMIVVSGWCIIEGIRERKHGKHNSSYDVSSSTTDMCNHNLGEIDGKELCGPMVRSINKCNEEYKEYCGKSKRPTAEEVISVLMVLKLENKYLTSHEKDCLERAREILEKIICMANGETDG